MKTRYVLIVTAMLIGCAVVISLRPGEERTEPRMPDTGGSTERQRQPASRAEKGAIRELHSPLAEEHDSRKSVMPATAPLGTFKPEAPDPRSRLEAAEPALPQYPPVAERRHQIPVGKRKNEPSGRQLNEEILTDLAYSAETIRFIRARWERSSADEIARVARSDPETWTRDDPRNTEIKDTLRSDLGDDLYDAMLYATNQPNRAKVGNVIGTSPAAAAGLRIRDLIVSYDGERVFDPVDAKRLSESADPGRVIEVWIQRDGEDIQLYVEGGPLGVRYFLAWKAPTRE